jgi:hypothetical protein
MPWPEIVAPGAAHKGGRAKNPRSYYRGRRSPGRKKGVDMPIRTGIHLDYAKENNAEHRSGSYRPNEGSGCLGKARREYHYRGALPDLSQTSRKEHRDEGEEEITRRERNRPGRQPAGRPWRFLSTRSPRRTWLSSTPPGAFGLNWGEGVPDDRPCGQFSDDYGPNSAGN